MWLHRQLLQSRQAEPHPVQPQPPQPPQPLHPLELHLDPMYLALRPQHPQQPHQQELQLQQRP